MFLQQREPVTTVGRLDALRRLMLAVAASQPPTDVMSRSRLALRIASHFLRCAARLETFRRWFGDTANAALREEIALRPSLVTHAIHPYLNVGWSVAHKLEVISGHYELLNGALGFLRFAPSEALILADFSDGMSVRIEKLTKFKHEGELVLSLFWQGRRVYSLAFTLGTIDAQTVAYAGALQGLDSEDALDTYRTLTHHLQGMRPRDLLVTAFRQLCGSLGVARILAVSDRHRVCSDPYFKSSVQVFTNYDSAWMECGGSDRGDGFFELLPAVTRRLAHEIPTRKRALYRRRYALLDLYASQIHRAVARATGRESASGDARQALAVVDVNCLQMSANSGFPDTGSATASSAG